MFDIDQVAEGLQSGFPVLFVGSGFSAAALNVDGKPLPTGSGLVTLLASELGFAKAYPLDVLSREYKSTHGEHGLLSLLTDRLTATSVSEAQRYVAGLAWHRIYTTNYDNVLELCRKDSGLPFKTVNAPQTSEVSLFGTQLPIVHINGALDGADIHNLEQAIRLTRESYLTEHFIGSNWLTQFRRDISIASVILIVGYSTSDIDIARILYADPTIRQRLFFIEPIDVDAVMKRELEQFGTVLDIGLDEFVSRLKAAPRPQGEAHVLRAFSVYEPQAPGQAATGDDVTKLLLYGDYNSAIQSGSTIEQKLYAVERTAVSAIRAQIGAGQRRFVLHSDLGNGKSIAIDQLRTTLSRESYRCLTLTIYDEFVENDLSYIRDMTGNIAIFTEDIFRNSKVVEKAITALPSAIFILSTRSAIFELQSEKLDGLLGESYLLHDLNQLDDQEIGSLLSLFEANGLWGELSNRRHSDKVDFLQRTCGRQLRTILIKLFESPSIRQKIISTFQDASNEESLRIVVTSLMLDIAGFFPDLLALNQLTGIDVYLAREKVNNSFSLEFLDRKYGSVRVKSAVFGEYVLQNVVSPNYVLDRLVQIVRNCETARRSERSRGDLFGEIQKEVMRFSFVDRVFARKLAGDTYKRYYDSIKDLPSMTRNPQFWLQYAIARLEDADFRASLIHFRTAYSHAKPKGSAYDTFQIDNHYARYLLVSRTQDPSYKDDFKIFLEAHKLLIAQATKDKEAYYNYKVAREYLPFYKARCGTYSEQQLEVVLNACLDIRRQIETVPINVKKYFVIDQCYEDLGSVVSDIERRKSKWR